MRKYLALVNTGTNEVISDLHLCADDVVGKEQFLQTLIDDIQILHTIGNDWTDDDVDASSALDIHDVDILEEMLGVINSGVNVELVMGHFDFIREN